MADVNLNDLLAKKKSTAPAQEEKPVEEKQKGLPLGLTLDDVFEIVKKVLQSASVQERFNITCLAVADNSHGIP